MAPSWQTRRKSPAGKAWPTATLGSRTSSSPGEHMAFLNWGMVNSSAAAVQGRAELLLQLHVHAKGILKSTLPAVLCLDAQSRAARLGDAISVLVLHRSVGLARRCFVSYLPGAQIKNSARSPAQLPAACQVPPCL